MSEADALRCFHQAEEARRAHQAALLEFQAACLKRDWSKADGARFAAVAAFEAYLDAMMAGYRETLD